MPASNQINFKRVILIISEGPTEKIALENIFKKTYTDKRIKFQYMYRDITSQNGVTHNNIENKINEAINAFIKRDKGFKKTDILRVVHIVDTDGCFVSDDKIIEDTNISHNVYTDNNIITNNKGSCKSRNIKKSKILNRLINVQQIQNIEYAVYYMSSNLDHVLHNSPNNIDKIESATIFKEMYLDKEVEFVSNIEKEGIGYKGCYEDSWNFIKSGTNSLKRKTNINLALKKTP